jgi:hypothetical protein
MESLHYGNDNYATNLVLVYQGKHHHVHKDILGLHCGFFSTLFSENKKENIKNPITIPSIENSSISDFHGFLRQIYERKKSVLTHQNVLGIASIAHWMDASSVREDCRHFFHEEFLLLSDDILLYAYEKLNYKDLYMKIVDLFLVSYIECKDFKLSKLNDELKKHIIVKCMDVLVSKFSKEKLYDSFAVKRQTSGKRTTYF